MIEEEAKQLKIIYDFLLEFLLNYSVQIFGALLIFIIGLYVANKFASFLQKLFKRHNIDITLSTFLSNLVRILIIVFVGIICLGKLGVSVTPFVAAIGAGALGAGLAFQGLLSNYAAGVTIIVTRPFVVGDTITIEGVTGVVDEITIGVTYLRNECGEKITIPNKHIVGEILHNSNENSLIFTTIGIAYDSDVDAAIDVVMQTLDKIENISAEMKAQVGVDEFGDSSINLGIRFWVPTSKLYAIKFEANAALFKALVNAGITIPFPQREVRMLAD